MKKVKSNFVKGLFLMAVVFMYSCQQEEVSPQNQSDIVNQKNGILQIQRDCDIFGPSTGSPGDVLSYSYTSSFTSTNTTWSVLSGDLSIQSLPGSNQATVILGSNFQGGEIRAHGNGNNGETCNEEFWINPIECPEITPPTQSWVDTEPCETLAMVVKNVSNATHFRFYIDNQFVGERPKNQNATTTHLLYSLITNSLNLSSGSHTVGISAVIKNIPAPCPTIIESSKLNKTVIIGFCNSPTPI